MIFLDFAGLGLARQVVGRDYSDVYRSHRIGLFMRPDEFNEKECAKSVCRDRCHKGGKIGLVGIRV